MPKKKIAISIDKDLLQLIDAKTDFRTAEMKNRSQTIETLLNDALKKQLIKAAIIMVSGSHHNISLMKVHGRPLITNQVNFLKNGGIKTIYIVTQNSKNFEKFSKAAVLGGIDIRIIKQKAQGTADVVYSVKDKIKDNFVVLAGDTYFDFNLHDMILAHSKSGAVATMGLATKEAPLNYGVAILDGNNIVEFKENPKRAESLVVNAGVYIFSPAIFNYLKNCVSLEKDVFPRLAKERKLSGFFVHGGFVHFG